MSERDIQHEVFNCTKMGSKVTITREILIHRSSTGEIDAKVMQELSKGLSKKFDLNISLEFVKNDFNGIKVDVEDLGIEINFSKTRINSQMIEHIVKAI